MTKSREPLLEKGLIQLGIDFTTPQIDALSAYVDEILFWNAKYKLVAVSSRDEIITRHILDSLAPLPILLDKIKAFGRPVTVADAGSGNGMPGIPLSIFLPDCNVTLIERSGRRVGFLRNALVQCEADRVRSSDVHLDIIDQDIQDVAGTFDIVVFRAFRALPDVLRALSRITSADGLLFAYKSRLEIIEQELTRVPEAQLALWKQEIIFYTVPFLELERRILILEKIYTALNSQLF
ncbi:MAG: 16S rRNA (guanine(527)-N(7))-methyltransferase RsmG [Bacteroidetes bacterium]|nr:16S rRNA (guanine(527)-N(7))-methyltransferase RsmG [Bacteroidota bacterium]